MEKNIIKTVKDSIITGVCTALAGMAAVKLCESTDGLGERLKDKVFRNCGEDKTLEEIFAED
jgi:hypothetical protein